MKTEDFNCRITANVRAEQAMQAISHVQLWWAKDFAGSAEKAGDVFKVKFGETFVDFKITEFVRDARIVWTVTDCYLPWQNDKTEWTGTNVIFEIATNGGESTINFTHQGLVPEVECYEMCIKGWTGYVTGSLLNLLTTGVGQPS